MLIRPAEPRDVARMHDLMVELAEYERLAHEVEASAADLHDHLFRDNPALFGTVAELDGEVVGMAIWFLNYSTWQGKHGLYLEDLYVQPAHRGKGLGLALMRHLAGICLDRGYGRFQWWVLDWNQPSIDFYKSIGAIAMDEWTVFRLAGDALESFAGGQ